MKYSHSVVVGLIVSAMAASALAHGEATGIVKDRMDAMSDLGKAMKAISQMIRGKALYEAQIISENAVIIKGHAGLAMTRLFPKNSMQKSSEAREEIWTNWNEFSALANQLETLATGLGSAADNGLTGSQMKKSSMVSGMMSGGKLNAERIGKMPVDGVFQMIAGTCKQCHEKFRLEKE